MRPAADRRYGLLLCAALLFGAAPALMAADAGGPALPTLVDTRSDIHPAVSPGRGGSFVFRNRYLVATLVRSGDAFESLYVYPATRPTELPSRPFAVAP